MRHARNGMRDTEAGHDGRGGRGKRRAFRGWRRSRPFWGGLLLLIAGLELLAIPLSGVLIKGQVKLVIYIGIGGVFGVLIGVLMIVAGVAVWVNPAHRVFYGIAGIVLGILSFPASNLGGFFLGMLLAILGGALAFAWTPTRAAPGPARSAPSASAPSTSAPPPVWPDTRTDPARPDTPWPDTGWTNTGQTGTGHSGAGRTSTGHRMLAVAAMPAMLVVGMAGAAGHAQSGNCVLLGLICGPGSSPSPSASATPSAPSSAGTSPSATANPSPGTSGSLPLLPGAVAGAPGASATPNGTSGPNAKKANTKKATVKNTSAPSGLVASGATSVLTASSATLDKLNLVGIVKVPVGGSGSGSEQAIELTASSASMTGVDIEVTQAGATTSTKTPTLGFSGGMTLYTTQMCGQVEGITPAVCFTPSTISAVVLKLASVLGSAVPITMTNVTVDQLVASGGGMQTGTLTMGL